MWHSGSASALHAESPGFDSPHLHSPATFEWSRVQSTSGAQRWYLRLKMPSTCSSVGERSIAVQDFLRKKAYGMVPPNYFRKRYLLTFTEASEKQEQELFYLCQEVKSKSRVASSRARVVSECSYKQKYE